MFLQILYFAQKKEEKFFLDMFFISKKILSRKIVLRHKKNYKNFFGKFLFREKKKQMKIYLDIRTI